MNTIPTDARSVKTTPGLTVIVHTRNSAATLEACLQSVQDWADEILVVDQASTDDTVKIARKLGARILPQPAIGYVEPSRQVALDAVQTDWTCILDADEELSAALRQNIVTLLQAPTADVFALPRKNMIFGKWAHGGWWPDSQIRLFRTGSVQWPPELHAQPLISGTAEQLPAKEDWAILHHNYTDINAFVQRALRYSDIAVEEVIAGKRAIVDHPVESFLRDFLRWHYAEKGSTDGTLGLSLSTLQSFFEVLVLTKYWEKKKFPTREMPPLSQVLDHIADEAVYWEMQEKWEKATGWKKWLWRLRMKLRL